MAAANYSSYNSHPLLKKKPVQATFSGGGAAHVPAFSQPVAKPVKIGSALLKKSGVPKPTMPTTAVPGAATLQAVPVITPPASGPPPQTLSSASDRVAIREGYGQGISDVNRGILNAALAYGGVDNVQQVGYDAAGGDSSSNVGVTHNPADNSALSVIARNVGAQNKTIDETGGAQNTFFSSGRLADLQNVNSEGDRQRAQAKKDYEDAIAGYTSQITGLRTDRDTGLRNADIADISAATANAPVNEQASAPVAAVGNPLGNTPAQNAVAHAGTQPKVVPGKDSKGNPGVWHIYPDGRRIFVRA